MRDVVAALMAVALLFFALRLATALTRDRRKRGQRTRSDSGQRTYDPGRDPLGRGPALLHRGRRGVPSRRAAHPEDGDHGRARPDQRRSDCRRRQPRSPERGRDIERADSGAAGGTLPRPVGRGYRHRRGHGSRPVRRHPRADLAGARPHHLRRGEAHHRGPGLSPLRGARPARERHHSISATPARWFTARANANNRSDRRLT